MAYQLEQQIRELGDRVPMNERARADQLIAETRDLVKKQSTDVSRLRQLTSDMQQAAYGLASGATPPGAEQQRTGTEDVIDADFTPRDKP